MCEDERASDKGAELGASFPIDVERGLRGDAGSRLVQFGLDLIAAPEVRGKKLRERDAEARRRTVEVLLANLVVAALNKLNPARYVAVPFNRSAYTGLGLSCDAMTLARNALLDAQLIDYVPGFRDRAYLGFIETGRVSRVRATAALRGEFARLGVNRRSVVLRRERLIRLKRAKKDVGPEPLDVESSRVILARINARLDAHDVDLPEDSWQRLKDRAMAAASDKESIPYVGDPTAKALYRVFTGDWGRGGRLYGGWWENIPKLERRHLTIDAEATTEIDFGHLHPALLYRAMGKPRDVDPYHLPPYSRDLCKETFQRLINGSIRRGGADLKRPKQHVLPEGIAFATFMADYKRHLHAVADCFGKNLGLILQCEDSRLALLILEEMDRDGIVTLPVHDSFIVAERHQRTLYQVMGDIYRSRYGIEPTLKVSSPPGGEPRAGHY